LTTPIVAVHWVYISLSGRVHASHALGPTVCVTRFLTPPAYTATFGVVHYVVPWLDVLISLDKLTFPFVVLVHIHGFVHSTRRVHEVKLDTV